MESEELKKLLFSISERLSAVEIKLDSHVKQGPVIPKELRRQVMSVNHESAFSGHLGAKKTEVRILPNFFWPGLRQDVIRFCRSCDVCQRTVKRGSVKKVPLGSMPLIDTPCIQEGSG